jgi:O-antigen/teichoic acid export membrane protein
VANRRLSVDSRSTRDGDRPENASVPVVSENEAVAVHTWPSPKVVIGRVRRDSLVRNSLYIMSTTIVNSVFGYVFWLLAARLFPAQVVGLTAGLTAASTILVILASVGVGGTLIQSLPGAHASESWSPTFWAGMATAVTVGAVIGGGTLLLLPLLGKEFAVLHGAEYAVVFAAGTFALIAGYILDFAFLAERAAGNMLFRNSVVAFGRVVLLVALISVFGANALAMLSAWTAAALAGLVLGFGLLVRRVALRRPPSLSVLGHTTRRLRTGVVGQQLIGIGAGLLPYLLSVLVTVRLSSSDNAYFYTTWMMAGIFLIIAPAVALSLFAEGVHDPRHLRQKVRSALTIIGLILVPGAVAILALGGMLLSVFGPAYEQKATELLRIVLLASFPDAITSVYVSVLRVQRRLAAAAGLNLGMTIGTVVLSWALLPMLGINAVGWAFLAMQLVGCAFVIVDLIRAAASANTPKRAGRVRIGCS